ncbi:MAG: hypothetical protein LQ350_006134 [Teloschistes chrysophthalmus]|nr:MAG: hypothetical protein LQ350_006134 [Niorma chrysophthalma]
MDTLRQVLRTWLEAYKSRTFPPNYDFKREMERGRPSIDLQDIDDRTPHPNEHDQVETAITDALQLALLTLILIDNDRVVYPHYFARSDRAMVKEVFRRVARPCSTGNVLLSNIHIQTTDINPPGCDEYTLAHMVVHDGDSPFIVLCRPQVWMKKAFTVLPGAGFAENNPARFLDCQQVWGEYGRVSWRVETLGTVLLHEYFHFNDLTKSVYGREILDQALPNGNGAYGPQAVCDNLNKDILARVNADSYTYYALHLFWREFCGVEYQAPLTADAMDVDCGGQLCRVP